MRHQFFFGQPQWVSASLSLNFARSHSNSTYSVGILWLSDRPSQRSRRENTRNSQEKNIHANGGDSNPQSPEASERRSTPFTERTPGVVIWQQSYICVFLQKQKGYILIIYIYIFIYFCVYVCVCVYARAHARVCGTAVAQSIRCCTTNGKVAVSIPAGVIEIFH